MPTGHHRGSQPKGKITIQDIADRADVSISTVSRVLNSTVPVAERKRQAVLAAIAELKYKPNPVAQGLAGGRSMTVGVLTQNVSSPFYDAILRGVLQGLSSSSYSPLFADGYWDATRERKALLTLVDRRVDGLIVLGGSSKEEFLTDINGQVPLVVVGRRIAALADRSLPLDDFEGAYQATRYLIELGHRRIVHITGILTHYDAVERRAGYMRALTDAKIDIDPTLIVEGDFSERSGLLAIEMLLTRGRTFSAIFAANDQMAYGVRLALFRRGLRVPDDVSIIGFDDQPATAYMIPPLSTIRQPAVEIGEAAAQAIQQILREQTVEIPVYRAELIKRESVARL